MTSYRPINIFIRVYFDCRYLLLDTEYTNIITIELFYINEFYYLTVDWNWPSKIRFIRRCSSIGRNRPSHYKSNSGFYRGYREFTVLIAAYDHFVHS